MASAINIGGAIVVVVLLAVIVGFFVTLVRGLMDDSGKSLLLAHRLACSATVILLAVAATGFVSNLVAPAVTMTVPISNVWPLPLPGVQIEGQTAEVDSAGTALAELVLSDLSAQARILWATGTLLCALLPATIALLVTTAIRQLRRDVPFAPTVERSALASGMVVLIAGVGGPVVQGIAGSMASFEALQVSAASWTGFPDDVVPTDLLPEPTVYVQVEFWPIGVALALFTLTAIFRYGRRLQRETEGLV